MAGVPCLEVTTSSPLIRPTAVVMSMCVDLISLLNSISSCTGKVKGHWKECGECHILSDDSEHDEVNKISSSHLVTVVPVWGWDILGSKCTLSS